MKKITAATGIAFGAIALAACGTSTSEPAPETPATVSTSERETKAPRPVIEETEVEAATTEPEPVVVPEPPTFVSCQLADGTALMSDGTTTYMDSCNESSGGPMVLEDGTSIYDALESQNVPQQMPGTYRDENGVSQMPDFQYGNPDLEVEVIEVPSDVYMP